MDEAAKMRKQQSLDRSELGKRKTQSKICLEIQNKLKRVRNGYYRYFIFHASICGQVIVLLIFVVKSLFC